MRRRIYADTSVIGGCLDDEWREPSRRLVERFVAGLDVLVISDITDTELENAPPDVRRITTEIDPRDIEEVRLGPEEVELAREYISQGVIGKSSFADAQHIALATTVHRVDLLVSWNFKHIVNLDRIHGYNSVNLRRGYPLLEIRTPREVLPYENRKEV